MDRLRNFNLDRDRDREQDRQDPDRFNPFFAHFDVSIFSSPPRRTNDSRLPRTPAVATPPVRSPFSDEATSEMLARQHDRLMRNMRDERAGRIPPLNNGRRPKIEPLFPLDPPSPMGSDEDTPTQSRYNTPSPPRSPVPEQEEYDPIQPPNTPIDGIPAHWQNRAEDNINMGFGFAYSWIDTIKPSRFQEEERISLPQIFTKKKRKSIIMFVAHQNVDDTLFHKIEVARKSEERMRRAIAKMFKLPVPFHRLRLKVTKQIEVALKQEMVDRFDEFEYFRMETKHKNLWILHQIVSVDIPS